MLLRNRLFVRQEPSREAKSIYIFCEGKKREYQYFQYFREMDSRINIEIYELDQHEDNSPAGLLKIANESIESSNAKYSFQENDEVWIVFDTDIDRDRSRDGQIHTVKMVCSKKPGWFVAESNPCFEVWLYYHKFSENATFEDNETCAKWKEFVNNAFVGGFDSRRHPIFIKTAIKNAERNFMIIENRLTIGSTEVYKLAKNIYAILSKKIEDALEITSQIKSNSKSSV